MNQQSALSGLGCLAMIVAAVLVYVFAGAVGWTGGSVFIAMLVAAGAAGLPIQRLVNRVNTNNVSEVQRIYGTLAAYGNVTYLGGHPEYRITGQVGILIATQNAFILIQSFDSAARTLCTIPYARVLDIKALTSRDSLTGWSTELPIPITWTTTEIGTIGVVFVNDVGDHSLVGFQVTDAKSANLFAEQLYNALYDWKQTQQSSGLHG